MDHILRELLRQQTEALRQQNEASRHQNQQQKLEPFAGPYLGLAMATMPKWTGNAKRDQRAWAKWLAKLDAPVQAALPSWSPEAYEQVRKMAVEQVMNLRN